MLFRKNNDSTWLRKEERLRAGEDPPDARPQNMDDFFLAFLLVFGNINGMEHRRRRYEALKQTKSVRQYEAEFTKIVQLLQPIPVEYEQKRQFTRGLKQEIRSELWKYSGAEATTLDELVR